ncbi:hypothetical protein HFO24_17040 [Rhizobium laguerreae]|uniref:hypothetical protein n=1 Tax=Rhizobium laguerreae TaxID=1076926 RepID=UPI001C921F49|nr:hypothetical protein [Rhizobium laguerreae]MBY3183360.1 hypothetical protein [Rhizobium laguerreae]
MKMTTAQLSQRGIVIDIGPTVHGRITKTTHDDMEGGVMDAILLIEANQSEKTLRLGFAVKISWASLWAIFACL